MTISRRVFVAATAALALPAALAHADQRSVAGTVSYRERIALPPDATLTVRMGVMQGTALGATLLAEQIVSPAGQVPIAFALEFDDAGLPADAVLAIDATIVSAGATLFATSEPVPLPATDADRIEIMAVRAERAPALPAITGVEWQAQTITGVTELGEARPTLTIGADGAAGGNAGCNRFFGKATISGEALAFGELGTTDKWCGEGPVMQIERAFLDALAATDAWRLEDGVLVLLEGDGAERVRLVSAA